MPDLPGIAQRNVATARDVLRGETVGDRIVVIGGGLVGCETADYLSDNGRNVTIIEMSREVAGDMSPASRYFMFRRLKKKGVEIFTSTIVKAIIDDGVVISSGNSEQTIESVDTVVLASGAEPVNDLASGTLGLVPRIYIVGDADRPGKLLQATQQAAEIARSL